MVDVRKRTREIHFVYENIQSLVLIWQNIITIIIKSCVYNKIVLVTKLFDSHTHTNVIQILIF